MAASAEPKGRPCPPSPKVEFSLPQNASSELGSGSQPSETAIGDANATNKALVNTPDSSRPVTNASRNEYSYVTVANTAILQNVTHIQQNPWFYGFQISLTNVFHGKACVLLVSGGQYIQMTLIFILCRKQLN